MSSEPPRVVVVGLGPAGADLVTDGTRALIEDTPPPARFLRTLRHPAAAVVEPATSCDDLYRAAQHVEEVYRAIVERLVTAAGQHGTVLYAVPGSPAVAERSVQLLLGDGRVRVEVHPALSFADLAWSRLGIDPLSSGARIVDGQRFAGAAAGERGPLLVAQCDSAETLAAVALALPEPSTEVWILHHLGLESEQVERLRADELARWGPLDHLTSLYIPEMAEAPAVELVRFGELVATLRAECPWDRSQTHRSLRRHLLEEVYEVLEAIDSLPEPASPGGAVVAGGGYEDLEEELGDLLFHIFFHATLAAEQGQFTIADVVRHVDAKLRHRHPHVFGTGSGEATDAGSLDAGWEELKRAEKGRSSAMDGIPEALPALLGALKVQKRAEAAGLDTGSETSALARLSAALDIAAGQRDEAWLGSLLFDAVELARHCSLDPESALRVATSAAREEFRRVENG
ncbi:MAG: SAM-dependent methyltransferase [bacterium]|nr:SAM-dependent methyltransferase [bacterium]